MPVVTRYPTGIYGLRYHGAQFYRTSQTEKGMRREIEELRIDPQHVIWKENYYDGPSSDPANYLTREYNPELQPDHYDSITEQEAENQRVKELRQAAEAVRQDQQKSPRDEGVKQALVILTLIVAGIWILMLISAILAVWIP